MALAESKRQACQSEMRVSRVPFGCKLSKTWHGGGAGGASRARVPMRSPGGPRLEGAAVARRARFGLGFVAGVFLVGVAGQLVIGVGWGSSFSPCSCSPCFW